MFQAAEFVNREVELSLLCRARAVDIGRRLPRGSLIFLNTHPSESLQIDVLPSIRRFCGRSTTNWWWKSTKGPSTISRTVRRFIAELKETDIQIAYDDFGAGRSRLLELIQAPPDYLKFDVSLIRDIHRGPERSASCCGHW